MCIYLYECMKGCQPSTLTTPLRPALLRIQPFSHGTDRLTH